MNYRHKVKMEQKTNKVKGQKRRVAEHGPWEGKYTDEEIASMVDYDYDYLLDTMYYKMERMVAFFNSKYVHIADAKKVAKQMKSSRKCVVVDNIESVYGRGMSKGYAKVYESKEAALEYDREYLLKRNGIEAKAPEAPAAEE